MKIYRKINPPERNGNDETLKNLLFSTNKKIQSCTYIVHVMAMQKIRTSAGFKLVSFMNTTLKMKYITFYQQWSALRAQTQAEMYDAPSIKPGLHTTHVFTSRWRCLQNSLYFGIQRPIYLYLISSWKLVIQLFGKY